MKDEKKESDEFDLSDITAQPKELSRRDYCRPKRLLSVTMSKLYLFPDRKYDLTEDSHKMVNIATLWESFVLYISFCILYLTLLY